MVLLPRISNLRTRPPLTSIPSPTKRAVRRSTSKCLQGVPPRKIPPTLSGPPGPPHIDPLRRHFVPLTLLVQHASSLMSVSPPLCLVTMDSLAGYHPSRISALPVPVHSAAPSSKLNHREYNVLFPVDFRPPYRIVP